MADIRKADIAPALLVWRRESRVPVTSMNLVGWNQTDEGSLPKSFDTTKRSDVL